MQSKLNREKKEIQKLATDMYETWCQIVKLRDTNQYASTSSLLKVYPKKLEGENGGTDYIFNLLS